VTPEEFGVTRAPLESIRGGTPAENAALIRRIVEGEAGPARDIVVVNAAAALVAAGVAANFREAAGLAKLRHLLRGGKREAGDAGCFHKQDLSGPGCPPGTEQHLEQSKPNRDNYSCCCRQRTA